MCDLCVTFSVARAVHPDTQIVVGANEVSDALLNAQSRKFLSKYVPEISEYEIKTFTILPNYFYCYTNGYGKDAFDLWRAGVLRIVAGRLRRKIPRASWYATARWAGSDAARRLMHEAADWPCIFVLNIADTWPSDVIEGALRTADWITQYGRLRMKIFTKTNITVNDLTTPIYELTWTKSDLLQLYLYMLINSPTDVGEIVRNELEGKMMCVGDVVHIKPQFMLDEEFIESAYSKLVHLDKRFKLVHNTLYTHSKDQLLCKFRDVLEV